MANPRIEELDDDVTQDVQATKANDASSDSEGSDNEGGEGMSQLPGQSQNNKPKSIIFKPREPQLPTNSTSAFFHSQVFPSTPPLPASPSTRAAKRKPAKP